MKRLLIAATLTALASPVLAQSAHGGHGSHDGNAGMSAASQSYMDAMSAMDGAMKSMEMSGEPGRDFAEMMIPHHQAAIDMAKAYLESGERDPDLTKLSTEIIAAQEREIGMLKAWLERNP